ncbi:MAG: hypothetical protein ACMZ7B_09140 [Balneola sp.]
MKFKSSSEFLEYLQKKWHSEKNQIRNSEQNKWKKDFTKISKERGERNGVDSSNLEYKRNHYDEMISKYVNDLIPLLSKKQSSQIGKNISIGSVNSNNINAVCTTDGNGNYAVVVNSSIFKYLHKFGKILLALPNPSIITYCNRKNFKELTQNDLQKYLIELPKIYFAVNEPKGPMIHLKDEFTFVHIKILEIAEKFIIGHELGHYFCGHLDDKSNTEIYLNDLEKLKNNNHKIEFEADDFGLNLINDKRNKFKTELIELAIKLLFFGLDSLNPYASESHPASIERMERLLKKIKTAHNNV